MKDQDQIKALAELDGVLPTKRGLQYGGDGYDEYKPYLTSRDAIVPVIEKWCGNDEGRWFDVMARLGAIIMPPDEELRDILTIKNGYRILRATPRQLSEALLHATNKWKE